MTGVAWDSVHMVYLLSEERMSTYIAATDGDLDSAFELYAWNIELAAALQSATAMVEVVARNAIEHVLTSWSHVKYSGSDWFKSFGARILRPLWAREELRESANLFLFVFGYSASRFFRRCDRLNRNKLMATTIHCPRTSVL